MGSVFKLFFAPLLLVAGLLAFAAVAEAQEAAPDAAAAPAPAAEASVSAWPKYELDPTGSRGEHFIQRGPGYYISIVKLVFTLLFFLLWVKTTDWLSQDCSRYKQNYLLWNSLVYGVFAFFFLVHLLIPSYAFGVILLLLAYAVPFAAYVVVRNKAVDEHERVLTKGHFRRLVASRAKKVGVEVKQEAQLAHQKGAPVEFKALGGATDRDNNANLLTAHQAPGYLPAKELIDQILTRNGDSALLDYTKEAVAVRYQIDGVWHNGEARDRESGDALLVVLKTLAALNPADRRAKQEGKFIAETRGRKWSCDFVSQGTQTGERAVVRLTDPKHHFRSFEQLGMRDKLVEQVHQLLQTEQGFLLFCSLPGNGLTSMFDAALEESDRLMRNYVAVEEVKARDHEIENVEVTTYDAAAGETPVTVLPKMIRKYPDVIVVRDLADPETVKLLCEQVGEKRLIFGGIRAKEAPEALLRVLMLKAPATSFAPVVTAVVNSRLIRKLCPACKIGYEPSPEILQKLGIPAGRVQQLFREPRPEEIEEAKKTCPECNGVGYKGRTGLFEVLVVNDQVREVLLKQPKLELAKKAARLAGMRSLQEEGIVLVAKGVTSLPELMRVLK